MSRGCGWTANDSINHHFWESQNHLVPSSPVLVRNARACRPIIVKDGRISHWFNGLRSPRWVSGPVLHVPMGDVVVSIGRLDPPGVENVQEFYVSEVPAKGPTAKIEPNLMRISRQIREARLDNQSTFLSCSWQGFVRGVCHIAPLVLVVASC